MALRQRREGRHASHSAGVDDLVVVALHLGLRVPRTVLFEILQFVRGAALDAHAIPSFQRALQPAVAVND